MPDRTRGAGSVMPASLPPPPGQVPRPVVDSGSGASGRARGGHPDPRDPPPVQLRARSAGGSATSTTAPTRGSRRARRSRSRRPSRTGPRAAATPVSSAKSSRLSSPSTSMSPPRQPGRGRRRRSSYSSRMSPTSSSTRSSRVTIPAVPPYSSTTIARCCPAGAHLGHAPAAPAWCRGQRSTSRTSSPTAHAAVGHRRVQQVAHVDEPDHVVVGVLRTPGSASAAGRAISRGGLVRRHRRVEELDLGARHHHLAQLRARRPRRRRRSDARSSGPSVTRARPTHAAQLLLTDLLASRMSGSPPSSRTSRSVEADSSQMTGRVTRASQSTRPATKSAMPSARCSASRLGASSPSTSET